MAPRPDVSEERKRQILEAAMAVFSRLGFHQARMDDIVEESGLSKGTLYWYFNSKDDIIIAILESLFESEFADLDRLLEAEGSISQRLLEFTNSTIADIQRMLSLLPLTYEFYALAFRQEAVRETLKSYLYRYVQTLEPLVQQGIDQGEFRPVKPRDVVIALGALIEGTVLLWVYDPEMIDLAYHGHTGMQLLLEGLQAREG